MQDSSPAGPSPSSDPLATPGTHHAERVLDPEALAAAAAGEGTPDPDVAEYTFTDHGPWTIDRAQLTWSSGLEVLRATR